MQKILTFTVKLQRTLTAYVKTAVVRGSSTRVMSSVHSVQRKPFKLERARNSDLSSGKPVSPFTIQSLLTLGKTVQSVKILNKILRAKEGWHVALDFNAALGEVGDAVEGLKVHVVDENETHRGRRDRKKFENLTSVNQRKSF